MQLYLLDTDLEENAPWDRELSARLYGGDRETRIQQEIILGIGGVRALRALGLDPSVFHLNEGHAAFVVLQRIREMTERGVSFDNALDEIRGTTIFTTHTPVPAGHDAFPFALVEKHLAGLWGTLGPNRDRFLALGAYDNGAGAQFNMTALALRSAGAVNAVSQLHGVVTREMWAPMWPGVGARVQAGDIGDQRRPRADVDCLDMAELFAQPSGHRLDRPSRRAGHLGRGSSRSPTRSYGRCAPRFAPTCSRSFASARGSAGRSSASARRASSPPVTLLGPDSLTIGFARRFTGYKRPELIFRDPERLARILNAAERPVQIIFAGKSHPADDVGKHHLQRVYRRALDPMFGGRVAFVDDYDLHVAHFLVQGCDVWLNNPRKPLEASGTSGMKAAINGVPHLSIGDGWWAEGFTGDNGWVINGGAATDDYDTVDAADADALYRLLEEEVVPAFYERDRAGLPHRWLRTVKEAIRTVTPRFCARRMVKEYVDRMYAPALSRKLEVRS